MSEISKRRDAAMGKRVVRDLARFYRLSSCDLRYIADTMDDAMLEAFIAAGRRN